MTLQARMCGVILAAGFSSRMGRDKALLPWPPAVAGSDALGETMLSAAIAALKPFTSAVIVVAGRNAEQLSPIVRAHGAALVVNAAPERGQFSSLQEGLRAALEHDADAAMITIVDCPPLSARSLELLCAAFERARAGGQWGVIPERNGKRGHPLIAGRALMDAFLAAPVTRNARAVRQAHAERMQTVAVPDLLLGVDVNTPEEYGALG
jgi:molybdenum cofactor cytidylyltransferase